MAWNIVRHAFVIVFGNFWECAAGLGGPIHFVDLCFRSGRHSIGFAADGCGRAC